MANPFVLAGANDIVLAPPEVSTTITLPAALSEKVEFVETVTTGVS